ncbi:hypothetical protein E8E11_000107 [Didymella keratinophila]|nr:hypothetical protein E8E11_000107 [Didymella keratinophila]
MISNRFKIITDINTAITDVVAFAGVLKWDDRYLQGGEPNLDNTVETLATFVASISEHTEALKSRLDVQLEVLYNLVAQVDSNVNSTIAATTGLDSVAMKALAFVTTLFLPPTFVADPWNYELTRGNLVYNGGQNNSSGLAGEATSEDCLNLAVWAPIHIPDEGLPVLFFMTGGGFSLGGVELPWQIPSLWVERSKSHIVVSINYRLNIFGFPSARGLKDGEQNFGILDQRAALEWVRDNIAAFGGNPERIMHWGRSAGSIAADMHAYAYHADPIAESYYLESGTVFSSGAVEGNRFSIFSFVAGNVGYGQPCGASCKDEDEQAAAELDCMRQVSQIQITNFIGQHNEAEASTGRLLGFAPVPDNKTAWSTNDYKRLSEEGTVAHRPTLIFFTSNEGSSLLDWAEDSASADINQTTADAFNVGLAACAALNSSAYRNRLDPNVPVFRFQYAEEIPNLNVYD